MASKDKCDEFAMEMARRFEDFVKWTMENWPNKDIPLLQSDFNALRKEIRFILGEKLNEAQASAPSSGAARDSVQYVNMNPAPWP
jgi:hypothetical protein